MEERGFWRCVRLEHGSLPNKKRAIGRSPGTSSRRRAKTLWAVRTCFARPAWTTSASIMQGAFGLPASASTKGLFSPITTHV